MRTVPQSAIARPVPRSEIDDWASHTDRVCFCCGRRESRIDHPRVGREGSVIAARMRSLMTWIPS